MFSNVLLFCVAAALSLFFLVRTSNTVAVAQRQVAWSHVGLDLMQVSRRLATVVSREGVATSALITREMNAAGCPGVSRSVSPAAVLSMDSLADAPASCHAPLPSGSLVADLNNTRMCADAVFASVLAWIDSSITDQPEAAQLLLRHLRSNVRQPLQAARDLVDARQGCMTGFAFLQAQNAWTGAITQAAATIRFFDSVQNSPASSVSSPALLVAAALETAFLVDAAGRYVRRLLLLAETAPAVAQQAALANSSGGVANSTGAWNGTVDDAYYRSGAMHQLLLGQTYPLLSAATARLVARSEASGGRYHATLVSSMLPAFVSRVQTAGQLLILSPDTRPVRSALNRTAAAWENVTTAAFNALSGGVDALMAQYASDRVSASAAASAYLVIPIMLSVTVLIMLQAVRLVFRHESSRREVAAEQAMARQYSSFVRYVSHEARSQSNAALLGADLLRDELLALRELQQAACIQKTGWGNPVCAPGTASGAATVQSSARTVSAEAEEGQLAVQFRSSPVGAGVDASSTGLPANSGAQQVTSGADSEDASLSSKLELIDTIRASLRQQVHIFTDALDWEKVSSGGLTLDMQPTCLIGEVQACMRSMLPTARRKGIRLLLVVDRRFELPAADAGGSTETAGQSRASISGFCPWQRARVAASSTDVSGLSSRSREGPARDTPHAAVSATAGLSAESGALGLRGVAVDERYWASELLPPLMLQAAVHRIRGIVGNLLSNSCKFSPADSSIVITVTFRQLPALPVQQRRYRSVVRCLGCWGPRLGCCCSATHSSVSPVLSHHATGMHGSLAPARGQEADNSVWQQASHISVAAPTPTASSSSDAMRWSWHHRPSAASGLAAALPSGRPDSRDALLDAAGSPQAASTIATLRAARAWSPQAGADLDSGGRVPPHPSPPAPATLARSSTPAVAWTGRRPTARFGAATELGALPGCPEEMSDGGSPTHEAETRAGLPSVATGGPMAGGLSTSMQTPTAVQLPNRPLLSATPSSPANIQTVAVQSLPPAGSGALAAPARRFAVSISVRDEGVGIGPEDLKRLFTPFTQIQAGQLQKGMGTGLGLAIAKRLAQAHGGDITVESEEGKGSTFTFTFVADEALEPHAGSPQPTQPAASALTDLHGESVLDPATSSPPVPAEAKSSAGAGAILLPPLRRVHPSSDLPFSRRLTADKPEPSQAGGTAAERHQRSTLQYHLPTSSAEASPGAASSALERTASPLPHSPPGLGLSSPMPRAPSAARTLRPLSAWKLSSALSTLPMGAAPARPSAPLTPSRRLHGVPPSRRFVVRAESASPHPAAEEVAGAIAALSCATDPHSAALSGAGVAAQVPGLHVEAAAGTGLPVSARDRSPPVLLTQGAPLRLRAAEALPATPPAPPLSEGDAGVTPLSLPGSASRTPSAALSGAGRQRVHALVVDDIRSNQLVLSKALASMGFVVAAADNGAEALRLLVQRQHACEPAGTLRPPSTGASPTGRTVSSDPESADHSLDAPRPHLPQFSIVLTDKSMPVMDGLDSTRRMRAAGYKGAIVGITGDATAEDRALFMRAGADEVLSKPVSKAELAAAIQRHLNA